MSTYTAFTANAFKITPKIPYGKSGSNKTKESYPFKNYMLDILPTISIILTDKFLDCLSTFVSKEHEKSTDSRYFSSGLDSAFIQDFLKRYINYEAGVGRSIEEVHDFVTAVLGFHDAEVLYDGGVATLYGLFSDLDGVANKPTADYVSNRETDAAMTNGEFTIRLLRDVAVLRQCVMTQTLFDRERTLQWYTAAMYVMQPTSLIKMVSVLFYVTWAMYDYMGDMEEMFKLDSELEGSEWLKFLWLYWLSTSVKKVYKDFDVSNYIEFNDNFVTMQEKLGYTQDVYNYLLASYNVESTPYPLFASIELSKWYNLWYGTFEQEHSELCQLFKEILEDLCEYAKIADLTIDQFGVLTRKEQKSSKLSTIKPNLEEVKLPTMEGAYDGVSYAMSARRGGLGDVEDRAIAWNWLNPSNKALKVAGDPVKWGDDSDGSTFYFCFYFISKRFLTPVEDAYKAIILPLNSYRHAHLFADKILPPVALLELENKVNTKRVEQLTATVNELKAENDNLKYASTHRTRDDKLKAFYDNAIEASDATITKLEEEQERLREHIEYLESCIADKSVITEAEETFEVKSTEKQIEELRKSGKKICVVGAHSINNLDDLTKGAVRQLVSENMLKLQKSLLANKESWDYIFLNTRAMSHSFYYTVKDGLRASAVQILPLSVTNAKAVVAAIYSAVYG